MFAPTISECNTIVLYLILINFIKFIYFNLLSISTHLVTSNCVFMMIDNNIF